VLTGVRATNSEVESVQARSAGGRVSSWRSPPLALAVNPRVDVKFNPRFNPGADDMAGAAEDDGAMTITDYLINAMFLLVVARQARERELDRRSVIVPLILVFFVAQMYLHSIPTAGNDLVLIGLLAAVGLTLGIASGFATHVRAAPPNAQPLDPLTVPRSTETTVRRLLRHGERKRARPIATFRSSGTSR
jgi:hypothetical protein